MEPAGALENPPHMCPRGHTRESLPKWILWAPSRIPCTCAHETSPRELTKMDPAGAHKNSSNMCPMGRARESLPKWILTCAPETTPERDFPNGSCETISERACQNGSCARLREFPVHVPTKLTREGLPKWILLVARTRTRTARTRTGMHARAHAHAHARTHTHTHTHTRRDTQTHRHTDTQTHTHTHTLFRSDRYMSRVKQHWSEGLSLRDMLHLGAWRM